MSNEEQTPNIREILETTIDKLENKDFNIYFFTMDTKGNPSGGIANIYEHVKILRELGYNASILHEKNDYTSVGGWLGEEYANLPHVSIENQQLKVSGQDFVIIPEIFTNVMEQITNMPCKKVVLCQSYDYIFEMLQPGKTWSNYNITDVITTTEKQREYINSIFPNLNVGVIPVGIPSYFKPTEGLKKPVIAIHTRDQRDTVKIFKTFYLKYPHLKWISFRDMRGMSREQFAKNLSESCLAIWVDEVAGFGTFPLEAIKSNVPVIGKVPNIIPDWMRDNNGIWVNNVVGIPEIAGKFVQAWLEDMDSQVIKNTENESANIYEDMKKMENEFTMETMKDKIVEIYGGLVNKTIEDFKTNLDNLPEEKEEAVEENEVK